MHRPTSPCFSSLRSTQGPAPATPLNNNTPVVATYRLVCAPPCVCTALWVGGEGGGCRGVSERPGSSAGRSAGRCFGRPNRTTDTAAELTCRNLIGRAEALAPVLHPPAASPKGPAPPRLARPGPARLTTPLLPPCSFPEVAGVMQPLHAGWLVDSINGLAAGVMEPFLLCSFPNTAGVMWPLHNQ